MKTIALALVCSFSCLAAKANRSGVCMKVKLVAVFFTILMSFALCAEPIDPLAKYPKIRVIADPAGSGGERPLPGKKFTALFKGNVIFQRYGHTSIHLNIKKVISGSLKLPQVKVYLVNDVVLACAAHGFSNLPSGEWTITRLPDNSFVVADHRLTPMKDRSLKKAGERLRKIRRDITKYKKDTIVPTLNSLCDGPRDFGLVKLILPMLDSKEAVIDPEYMRGHLSDGRSFAEPGEVELGKVARAALVRLLSPIRTSSSPTEPSRRRAR